MNLEPQGPEVTSPIPWQCWDIPGFKECHKKAHEKAFLSIQAEGFIPGTPIFNEFAKRLLNIEIYDCQSKYFCSKGMLQTFPRKSSSSTSSKGYLLGIVGIGIAAYLLRAKLK